MAGAGERAGGSGEAPVKPRYRFVEREWGFYVWELAEGVPDNDKTPFEYSASIDWFWSTARRPQVIQKLHREHGARKTMELLPEFDPAHGALASLDNS